MLYVWLILLEALSPRYFQGPIRKQSDGIPPYDNNAAIERQACF